MSVEAEMNKNLKKKSSEWNCFYIPEWRSSTNSYLENSTNDLQTIQEVLGENKMKKQRN